MDNFFSILFSGLADMVSIMQSLSFSALGFNITLWDFQMVLFVAPVLFSLLFASGRVIQKGRSSERNDKGGT